MWGQQNHPRIEFPFADSALHYSISLVMLSTEANLQRERKLLLYITNSTCIYLSLIPNTILINKS
jgi:hypothetical protein